MDDIAHYQARYDLVVASDSLNSKIRAVHQEHFEPDIDLRHCQFVWLGTNQHFDDAFTFIFEETDKGWIWAHSYQFDDHTATFIVECSQNTFDAFGYGDVSHEESIALCEEIFKSHLGGRFLVSNARCSHGSAWIRLPQVLCASWSHENIVLLGDAAATAHFSVGSGTKLALESAVALADCLHTEENHETAFNVMRMNVV